MNVNDNSISELNFKSVSDGIQKGQPSDGNHADSVPPDTLFLFKGLGKGMKNGYIQLKRESEDKVYQIMKKHYPSYLLLNQIAYRARWKNQLNDHENLQLNEALIGDNKTIGISNRQYRTAKVNLSKWHFSTFKETNKGTIATLLDSSIFDINSNQSDNQDDKRPTSTRQAPDKHPTTKEKDKKDKKEKKRERKNSLSHFSSFSEPSLDDVKNFVTEEKLRIDPEKWFYHYKSNGWLIGNRKMQDWRSSVRKWDKTEKQKEDAESNLYEIGFKPQMVRVVGRGLIPITEYVEKYAHN
jgi:hypothetical protein